MMNVLVKNITTTTKKIKKSKQNIMLFQPDDASRCRQIARQTDNRNGKKSEICMPSKYNYGLPILKVARIKPGNKNSMILHTKSRGDNIDSVMKLNSTKPT